MTKITQVAAAVMLTTFAGVSMAGTVQAAKIRHVCEHKVSKRIYTTCASSHQRLLRYRQPTGPIKHQNFRARTASEFTTGSNGGGEGGGHGGRGGQGGKP